MGLKQVSYDCQVTGKRLNDHPVIRMGIFFTPDLKSLPFLNKESGVFLRCFNIINFINIWLKKLVIFLFLGSNSRFSSYDGYVVCFFGEIPVLKPGRKEKERKDGREQ